MNVQVSPDGNWWWNGQAWTPMVAYAPPPPARRPGALVAAVAINLVGAALILLLGLLLLVVSRTTDLSKNLADTPNIDPATWVLILTVGVTAWGIYLVAVNSLLSWFLYHRAAWAWITTVVLLALGILAQLFSAIGSPQALIWLVLFQIPPLVLLLLGPSRKWCRISGGQSQQPYQYLPYAPYPPYGGYQPTQPLAPPPPPATPPQF